ncbi:MAG: methyltransferase domain-containing protein [Candidatus Paceibacterota bacterium]|jgi:ubiquinone/menaquinone biosynthesis C-methylase UbiE
MAFSDPERNIEQFALNKKETVADLGSGSGFYTFAAARAVGSEGRVYSIDIQKDILNRVKKEADTKGLHNVEIVWGDTEKVGGTRLREASIDAAIASNILFQLSDRETFAEETYRMLRPGGRLLVVDWSGTGMLSPRAEDIFSEEQARALFSANHFVFEKNISAGDHHYGLIFKKQ